MRARTTRVQKEVALQPDQVDLDAGTAPDAIPIIAQNRGGAGPRRASSPSCSASECSCSSATARSIRRSAEGQRRASGRAAAVRPRGRAGACSRSRTSTRPRVLEEQTLSQNLDGGEGRRAGSEHEERRLQRDGARGEEQPPGLRVAAAARERTARLEQQPLEQRARRRSRRSAEGADDAERPADLADVARASAWCWRSRWRSASTT